MIPFDANEKICNNRSGVYAIVNIKTEKFYIGSAVKLRNRKYNHLWKLRRGKHDCIHLQRSYNKYGEDVFVFKVLEYVEDKNNLLKVEQKYLDIYFPTGILYNILPIAGNSLGYKHTEENKKIMSKLAMGRVVIHSEETKMKISLSNKGKSKPKGRKLSLETKQKLSLANKGKKRTPEMIQAMSLRRKGIKLSDEQKKKISENCTTKRAIIQFDKDTYDIINIFDSTVDVERKMNIFSTHISAACSGKYMTVSGYIWRYLEE